jgi:hypothetical protein
VVIFLPEDQLDAVKEAYAMFQEANDTKAAIIISLAYSSGQVHTILFVILASADI